jgi:hypothetical protein
METPGNITYLDSAGDDQVIATSKAVLKRVIIGKSVATSVVQVSDSPTTGDADVKFYLEGDALLGTYEVNAVFETGIAVDLANQTDVILVWEPLPHAISS